MRFRLEAGAWLGFLNDLVWRVGHAKQAATQLRFDTVPECFFTQYRH